MSRSFGDQIAHSCGVIEEPEVKIVSYNPKVHRGLFLASDGVWEHVSNNMAAKLLEQYVKENQTSVGVDVVVINALQKWKITTPGYVDDTSAILALFK